MHGPRRANECFAGDAAVVQAIAAEQMPFDQRRLSPQPRRSQRRNDASRSPADGDQV